MGAQRSQDTFDFVDVFETMYGSDASGGGASVVTCQVRDAGEPDGQDGRDVELWGMGCVVYRPAKPDANGKCQLLVTPIGSQPVAIASQDSRAAKAAGAMNEGDAAFCSPTGKVAVRCNADNSFAILRQGSAADAFFLIEKDGSIKFGNQWGMFTLDSDGFSMISAAGEALTLGGGSFQVLAAKGVIGTGTVALGATASRPLTFAPVSGIAGPAPNIFV